MPKRETKKSQSCCYCGSRDPNGLIMCNVCKKWFCNCVSMREGSHAFLHLSIAHHNSVCTHPSSVFRGNTLRCSSCNSTNVFDLRFNPNEERNGAPLLMCLSKCISKRSRYDKQYADDSWFPIIDDRRFISPVLAQPPLGPDARNDLCVDLIRQYEVLCLSYPTLSFNKVQLEQTKRLEKTKLDYENTLEYYNVFEPLLRVEASEMQQSQLMDGDKHANVHFMRDDTRKCVVASFCIHMCEYSRTIREWDNMMLTYCLFQDDYDAIDNNEYKNHMKNLEYNRRRFRNEDESDATARIVEENNQEEDDMPAGAYANLVNEQRIEYGGSICSLEEVDPSVSLFKCTMKVERKVIPKDKPAFEDGFYDIRLREMNSTLDRRTKAIVMMDQESSMHQMIFDVILGYKEIMGKHVFSLTPEEKRANYDAPNLMPLNEPQRAALIECLQSRFTLIQGPPGTGKTNTAATIVYQMVQRTHNQIPDVPKKKYADSAALKGKLTYPGRVLVCAPSNVAADEICGRIHRTGVNVVRLMAVSKEEMPSPVEELCVHVQAWELLEDETDIRSRRRRGEHIEESEWRKYLSDVGRIKRQILMDADVVVCTCDTAGSNLMNGISFPTVLIDEASQTTEPEVLIPIVHGAQRVIMVGDQCQLQPVVISLQCKSCKYDRSLFERLIELGMKTQLLSVQYRMHPVLSEFSNSTFYDNKLVDGITERNRPILSKFPFPDKKRPLVFWHVVGKESLGSKGGSYQNFVEAMTVIEVIRSLVECKCPQNRIGVITSYTGQRLLLMNLLVQHGLKDVECSSVNMFQGREMDYIVYSCVRSNTRKEVGFLKDPKRLNVALTRARYGMVVVGNASLLCNEQLWSSYVNYHKSHRTLVEGSITSWRIKRSLFPVFNKHS